MKIVGGPPISHITLLILDEQSTYVRVAVSSLGEVGALRPFDPQEEPRGRYRCLNHEVHVPLDLWRETYGMWVDRWLQ